MREGKELRNLEIIERERRWQEKERLERIRDLRYNR